MNKKGMQRVYMLIWTIIFILLFFTLLLMIRFIYLNPTRILQNEYCWETNLARYDYYRGGYFCVFINKFGSIQREPFPEDKFEVWRKLNE